MMMEDPFKVSGKNRGRLGELDDETKEGKDDKKNPLFVKNLGAVLLSPAVGRDARPSKIKFGWIK